MEIAGNTTRTRLCYRRLAKAILWYWKGFAELTIVALTYASLVSWS
jgi:hypothetical protein